MLVSNIQTKSILYRNLEALGLLCTDDYYVRTTRPNLFETKSFQVPLSNDPIWVPVECGVTETINGKDYQVAGEIDFYGSVISIHLCEYPDYDRDSIEIWVGDQYIPSADIRWIRTEVYDHAILPDHYDEYDEEGNRVMATIRFYEGVFKRYSVRASKEGSYIHTATIDFSQPGACLATNPYCCLFYYADGKLCIPTPDMITRKSGQTYVYQIPYTRTLDAYWCSSLVSTFDAKAGVTFNLHSPEDHVVYPRILVGDTEDEPINTLFYPSARVEKDAIVRVFKDGAREVPCPEVSRLQLYPEFLDIEDFYDTDNEYINSLEPCDAFIEDTDSDEELLQKFRGIAPYCYRIGDYLPKFADEQSDFLVLDNFNWEHPYIEQIDITRANGSIQHVTTFTAPYESYRDILFYNGWIYSDYEVVKLKDGVEDPFGIPSYVIHDQTLDLDKLQLIKFNTNEDTVINNIGDWIDENNLVQLHEKLNRFYRNLLVLRGSVLDSYDNDAVRVSTVPPTTIDDKLWFELLLNTEPMDFEVNPIDTIVMNGLDPEHPPEGIVNGAMSLDLDPDYGPQEYTDLVMTYYNFEDRLRDHLILQLDAPEEEDSKTYNSVTVGKLPERPVPNDIALEVQKPKETSTEEIHEYYTGDGDPDTTTYDPGDTYLNLFKGSDGTTISKEDAAKLSTEEKIEFVESYIAGNDPDEIAETTALWNQYLVTMDEETLNTLVYKVMITDYFYTKFNTGAFASDELVPKDEAIHHNLSFVLSEHEPDNLTPETTWIDVPVIPIHDYIWDMVCKPLFEVASYDMPEGEYEEESSTKNVGTLLFDYMPHGIEGESEEFLPVVDDTLHEINYGTPPETPEQGDIWYEFLDKVHNRICYSDESSMVLFINEHLIRFEFDHDNVTAFVFDDILMNFRGKLGLRYLSIVADLINSGVITKDQINVFYHRLITGSDEFDPMLKRFYNGRSHVLVSANVDTTDLGVLYSTNIGRFHVDYNSDQITNLTREWAWRHVIDYRQLDLSFLPDRMILFVNGRPLTRSQFVDGMVNEDGKSVLVSGMLQLVDFDEVIENIDIFYSVKDLKLTQLKQLAVDCWKGKIPDVRMLSRTDKNYGKFRPIVNRKYTRRGFYDVLLEEYILNGRLLRYLDYFQDHPDEYEEFRKDMVSYFHDVSDKDYTDGENDFYDDSFRNRIVIPALGTDQIYQIGVNRT